METDKKKLILIVDDMELNREILSLILHDKYDIIEAENGLEAKEVCLARGAEISLILLDIIMPLMDGFEFLDEITKYDYLRNIPIIFVTSETYESNVLKAVRQGARDVIAKPFDPYFLCKRVDNLIQLNQNREGEEHTDKAEPKTRLTALIVDDKDLNRMILRAAIDDTYDVLEAAHGQDALFLLEKHKDKIGIILLDIIMPIMDGIETMKEIRRRNLFEGKPVLTITAEESTERINELKELGISEVIHKPFNPVIVKNRMDYLVELSFEQNGRHTM